MAIKNKNKDPKIYEFSAEDIVINTKEGTVFFKSNNKLYKIKGDDVSTTLDESTSETTSPYNLTKLYDFRFFLQTPYSIQYIPAFGGGTAPATNLDYSLALAAPYDGKITEISFSYPANTMHNFWEIENPKYKIAGHKNTGWVQTLGTVNANMTPTSHQNIWEDSGQNVDAQDDFTTKAAELDDGAATSYNNGTSFTHPFIEPVQEHTDKIRRLQVFKFDNFTFKKGDMCAITLEIDNTAYYNANVVGHTTVMYDTTSTIQWTITG